MYFTAMVCDYRLAEEVYKAGVSFCMHKGGCSFNMLTGKSYLKSMNHCRTVWPLFMDDIFIHIKSLRYAVNIQNPNTLEFLKIIHKWSSH